ncbi:hypothetical protein ACLB2K_025443 [Fragaria x ananassa]
MHTFKSLSMLKYTVLEPESTPFLKAHGETMYEYMSKKPELPPLFDEFATVRCRRGRVSTPADSSSVPDESDEFQFSGQITQNIKQSRSSRKTEIWRTCRGWKVVGEAAGVEARPRRCRTVANGGTSAL